jgi:hypothetical protein
MTTKRVDLIVEGHYRCRLVRKGIHVGVRFWFDQIDNCWRVEVDGRTHRADGEMLNPYEVWPWCEPVTAFEYEFMERRRQWAQQHAPDHPAANAFEAVDLSRLPPRF